MDEASFNTVKNDRLHWARKGHPITCSAKFLKQKPVYVCGMITSEAGIVSMVVKEKAFKSEDIALILEKLVLYFTHRDGSRIKFAVFLDNARFHYKNVTPKAAELDIPLIYNAGYRPDLNGIELFWREAKQNWYKVTDHYRANNIKNWDAKEVAKNACMSISRPNAQGYALDGWRNLFNAAPIPIHDWEKRPKMPLQAIRNMMEPEESYHNFISLQSPNTKNYETHVVERQLEQEVMREN
jgi:hypothetical protein